MSRLSLFPLTTEVNDQGNLIIGGCDTVELANKMSEEDTGKVTIAGKFYESGDILVQDINLPPVSAGDIIAVPNCGAYCLPMASNYNSSLKPAIVLVKEGKAHLIRRRETFDDRPSVI